MKITIRVLLVALITILLLVWVCSLGYVLQTYPNIEHNAVSLVIAPFSETLFYLYLPMLLAREINRRFGFNIEIPIMLFVAFQFILLHEDNYSSDGRYLACVFQGVMYYFCYLTLSGLWKRGGYWYTVLLHTLYNFGIVLVVNHFI